MAKLKPGAYLRITFWRGVALDTPIYAVVVDYDEMGDPVVDLIAGTKQLEDWDAEDTPAALGHDGWSIGDVGEEPEAWDVITINNVPDWAWAEQAARILLGEDTL